MRPQTPVHFIRSAHFLVQQYWLECDNFLHACQAKEMQNVEHLIVTLRRSDFWNWEQGRPIGLDPRLPLVPLEAGPALAKVRETLAALAPLAAAA